MDKGKGLKHEDDENIFRIHLSMTKFKSAIRSALSQVLTDGFSVHLHSMGEERKFQEL